MQSIAAHLSHAYGAESVKLYLKQHRVPARQEFIDGTSLTDESLYRERYLGTLAADGTWQIGVSVATKVLTEAALKYYGFK